MSSTSKIVVEKKVAGFPSWEIVACPEQSTGEAFAVKAMMQATEQGELRVVRITREVLSGNLEALEAGGG